MPPTPSHRHLSGRCINVLTGQLLEGDALRVAMHEGDLMDTLEARAAVHRNNLMVDNRPSYTLDDLMEQVRATEQAANAARAEL